MALYQRGNNNEEEEDPQITSVGGVVADGTMKMLRLIELTTTMVTDHFCKAYAKNLDDLVRDL